MNNKINILKLKREKFLSKRISVITKTLKLTIPRKIKISGHFNLKSTNFSLKSLIIGIVTN